MNLLDLTASQAVPLMRQGDLTVEDYCDALIEQQNLKQGLNAFIAFDENLLREQASALDTFRSKGGSCGPLFGLPMAVKDNIETSGYATTGGTGALKNYRPQKNAPKLQQLIDKGAMVMGKTNLHELAFGITSNNGVFGPVKNPYNTEMISGGSSGGSAVAVAAHIAPFAVGTDTGGSTRIPPALCGIVGYRPTMDRYGSEGAVPISHTRDTLGTMARSVDDIEFIDRVLASNGETMKRTDLKGIRLGVSRDYFYSNLDADVATASEKALKVLKRLGAEIIEVNLENLAALNEAISLPICLYEAIADMEIYLQRTGIDFPQLIDGMGSPDVKGLYQAIRAEPPATSDIYQKLITEDRPKLQRAYAEYFQQNRLDAMVFPTTKLTARPIGEDETVVINGEELPTFQAYIHNTDPSSNAGLPGLSVPMGLSRDGLPMGLEIDGPEKSDRKIMEIARLYQQASKILAGIK